MTTQEIVSKLWNLCNVLRDDGITYHQYVTETMLDATVRKGGLVAVAGAVTDADEPEETDVGMAPPEAVEELSEEVDDFLSDFFGYL